MQANGEVVFDSNVINYNNAYPLKAYADQICAIVGGSTFANVDAYSYIEVSGSTISRDANWLAVMPYHITSSIAVQGTDGDDAVTTLTVAPGAILRFNSYRYLQVGNSSGNPGALSAVGEWDQPVVFTSNQTTQAPGDWYGIRFYNTADDNLSELTHCTVEYGGYGNSGNIYCYQASPDIHYSIIRNSSNYGIYIHSATPLIRANSISANSTYGIYNATSANTVVATNN